MAVPWGVVGQTGIGPVRFERGSLTFANQVLLRDHDRTKAIGVVAEGEDVEAGIKVKAKVSSVTLGDETLTLAADGALKGFSVGVRPTKYSFEEDDTYGEVLVVAEGKWEELSVVPFQAFSQATIEKVAASAEETPTVETTETPAVVTATVPTPEPVITVKPRRVNAGELAQVMILAQKGNLQAQALVLELVKAEVHPQDLILAALTGHTTTSGNEGILPPSYSADILGGLPVATPFTDSLCRKTGLPATGMSIVKPEWETLPKGGWVTTENSQPPTNAVSIGTKTVSVLTYAHAVLASLNLVNRSDFGGFASAYYSQVGIDYLAAKEAKVVEEAQGAATDVPGTATSTSELIGMLVEAQIAAQLDTTDPSPRFRGLMPEYAAVAPNLWADLVETKMLEGPAFSSGSIEWGTMRGSLSGLIVVMVPALVSGKALVGARAAVVLHDGSEMQLRSLVVNTLSAELGVMGNCAVDVEYPKALAQNATAFAPTGTAAKAAAKKA